MMRMVKSKRRQSASTENNLHHSAVNLEMLRLHSPGGAGEKFIRCY